MAQGLNRNDLEAHAPSIVFQLLVHLLKCTVVTCIWGPPGIGKSDVVIQAANMLGWDVLILHPVISDPTDFKGLPCFTKNGSAEFVPFAELLRMMTATKPLIVFLDDIGQASPAVQAACMQLLQARCIGGKRISDEVRFVCASNRAEDKAACTRMLTPLLNRVMHLDMTVSHEDWMDWSLKNNIDQRIRAYIRYQDTIHEPRLHMWNAQDAQIARSFPTPRSWSMLSRALEAAPKSLLVPLACGAVGTGAGKEFVKFCVLYTELPEPSTVTANGATAELLSDPAKQWGFCGAVSTLAKTAKPRELDNIVVYALRLGQEMGVFLMRSALHHNDAIRRTPNWNAWLAANKDFLNASGGNGAAA